MLTSKLENKWWFAAPVCVLTTFVATLILDRAGIGFPDSVWQWLVAFCCYFCIGRSFSFLGWLAVLLIAPSNEALDR
jgi:hypothetical protein